MQTKIYVIKKKKLIKNAKDSKIIMKYTKNILEYTLKNR